MSEFTKSQVADIRAIHVPGRCASCAYSICQVCREKFPCTAESRVRDDGWLPVTVDAYPTTAAPRRRTTRQATIPVQGSSPPR